MNINKLKILFIAICYVVLALWPHAYGTEYSDQISDEPSKTHQATLVPPGSIVAFAGKVPPHGWLLCDGGKYSNQEYPKLYQVIGTKYVEKGSWIIEANKHSKLEKHFGVPDLRGRVIIGIDGGSGRITSNNTLGATGGSESVTLTIDHIPIHDHVVKCSPKTQLGGPYPGDIIVPSGSPRATQNRHTDSVGGGQPHNNIQPYQVLNYIINTGNPVTPIDIIMEYCDPVDVSEEWLEGAAFYTQKILYNKRVKGILDLSTQSEKINQLERKIEELRISQRGCAKAWVAFNGYDATILDSYGVLSVIKKATARYTVNFSRPFSSENYCVTFGTAGNSSSGHGLAATGYPDNSLRTRHSFELFTFIPESGKHTECSLVSACFHGS